jgi:hypothetical protein
METLHLLYCNPLHFRLCPRPVLPYLEMALLEKGANGIGDVSDSNGISRLLLSVSSCPSSSSSSGLEMLGGVDSSSTSPLSGISSLSTCPLVLTSSSSLSLSLFTPPL